MDPLDAVMAAPNHHKVLLENDQIRVLETLIRPGEETAVHTPVWPGYIYIISWGDFVRYDSEGRVRMDSRQLASAPRPGRHFAHHFRPIRCATWVSRIST